MMLWASSANAEFYWNSAISANGTDTVSTTMGQISVSIEDLNNNTISTTAMVNATQFPSNYKVSGITTFKETLGSSYKVTFATAVDYPIVAVASLGNGLGANRFVFDKVNGSASTVDIVFADAWGNASGSEGSATVGNLTSYGPNTYGTDLGIGIDSDAAGSPKNTNLSGVSFFESKEGNIVARVNQTNVTTIEFSLSNAENYMTLMMGYDSVVDPTQSTVTASPVSGVLADNSATSTITVQLVDNYGNLNTRGGETVTIASDLGTVSSVTDNNNGTYTATLKSSTAGTANISATVGGTIISGGSAQTVGFVNAPPVLASSTPADNASGVALNASIVLTFNEVVDVETGSVVIKETVGGAIFETINVTSSQVTGTGTTTITVMPSSNFQASTGYYVEIDATAFDDPGGLSYAGIASSSALNFTTGVDNTPPTIVITAAEVSDGDDSNHTSLSLAFTLSEASSNFAVGDITLSNATLTNFSGSGATYTATLTPVALGAVTVDVVAGTFTDSAANNNVAATQFNWQYGEDPSKDAGVIGIVNAQASLSNQFKTNSIKAVFNRLQWLDRNKDSLAKSHQGVKVSFTDPLVEEFMNGNTGPTMDVTIGDAMIAVQRYDQNSGALKQDATEQARILVASAAQTNIGKVNLNPSTGAVHKNWYLWSDGMYTIGETEATANADKQESNGQVLTVGLDRVSEDSKQVVGFAFAYGIDEVTIGSAGSNVQSDNYSLSAYSTFEPEHMPRVEALLGVGRMNIKTVRMDSNVALKGERKSNLIFGSVGMRGESFNRGQMRITPYGQLETAYIKLGTSSETGSSFALAYSEQNLHQTSVSLGLNLDFEQRFAGGKLRPYGKFELAQNFDSDSGVDLNYVGNSTIYSLASSTSESTQWIIGLGADYMVGENSKMAVAYETTNTTGSFLNSLRFEINVAF